MKRRSGPLYLGILWLLCVAGLIGWTAYSFDHWDISLPNRFSNRSSLHPAKDAPGTVSKHGPTAPTRPSQEIAFSYSLWNGSQPPEQPVQTPATTRPIRTLPVESSTSVQDWRRSVTAQTRHLDETSSFSVVEAIAHSREIRFVRRQASGREWFGTEPGEWRRAVPSYHQTDFPEPESGCGPIAILNWLTWYQNIGMLTKNIDQPGTKLRARHNHRLIEKEIVSLRNKTTGLRGGTTSLEIICAFDRIVNRLSSRSIRLAYEVHDAPMSMDDLTRFTRGFRSAILLVRPVNPKTGQLESLHAVSVVAGDRAGYLMLNNWGERLHGALRNEADGQFFAPSNIDSPRLKIEQLICLIPFTPDNLQEFALVDLPQKPLNRRPPARPQPSGRSRNLTGNRPNEITPAQGITLALLGHTTSVREGYFVRVSNQSNTAVILHLQNIKGLFANGREYFPTSITHAPEASFGKIPRQDGLTKGLYLTPGDEQDYFIEFNHIPLLNNKTSLPQLRWTTPQSP